MTYRNLSVELRPQRLSEMVGQDELVANIRGQFSTGQVPIAMLLTGSFGTGKTTIARILGLSFQCDHGTAFGEPCNACVENEDMFHIIERNCAELTTLESVKEFIPTLFNYPNFGKYRVIILDEAQQMSDKAQQALLKHGEVDGVNIFIFCTSDPTKINQAVKDRAIPFAIPEMSNSDVVALVQNTMSLAQSRFGIEPRDPEPLIKVLHTAQMKSSRNIVMATDMFLHGAKPEQAIVIKEAGQIDYYSLFRYASQGDWEKSRFILANAKPADGDQLKTRMSAHFRDILIKTPAGSRADLLSSFIRELAEHNVVEAGLQLSATISTIYRICQTVNEIKQRTASTSPVTGHTSLAVH